MLAVITIWYLALDWPFVHLFKVVMSRHWIAGRLDPSALPDWIQSVVNHRESGFSFIICICYCRRWDTWNSKGIGLDWSVLACVLCVRACVCVCVCVYRVCLLMKLEVVAAVLVAACRRLTDRRLVMDHLLRGSILQQPKCIRGCVAKTELSQLLSVLWSSFTLILCTLWLYKRPGSSSDWSSTPDCTVSSSCCCCCCWWWAAEIREGIENLRRAGLAPSEPGKP